MRQLVTSVGILLVLATPGAASAAWQATGSDPVDAGLPGGRDVVGLTAAYDEAAGAVTATVKLREAPSAAQAAAIGVQLGTAPSGDICAAPFAVVVALTDPAIPAAAAQLSSGLQGPATKRVDGREVTLSVTDAAAANLGLRCAQVQITDVVDTETVIDTLGAPLALTQGAAPQPQPQPQPGPKPKPAARLVLSARPVSAPRPGAWKTAKVRVTNRGTRVARRVTIVLSTPAGADVRPGRIVVKRLRAGASRTVSVRVRAASTTRIGVRAAGRGTTATGTLPVTVRRRTGPTPGPTPTTGLAGSYYTRVETDPISGSWWRGYVFLDGSWAYRGVPKGGFPTCTSRTAGVDEDGDPTDGCVPYTYDAGKRTLTIDGRPAQLSADRRRLSVDDTELLETPVPAPGTTFDVDIESLDGFGFGENITVTHRSLHMRRDGRFSLASDTGGTVGSGGEVTGGFGNATGDQQGTYEVLSGARLQLRFDSGKVEIRTIGIQRDWETGRADPAIEGLLLDDTWFYKDDD